MDDQRTQFQFVNERQISQFTNTTLEQITSKEKKEFSNAAELKVNPTCQYANVNMQKVQAQMQEFGSLTTKKKRKYESFLSNQIPDQCLNNDLVTKKDKTQKKLKVDDRNHRTTLKKYSCHQKLGEVNSNPFEPTNQSFLKNTFLKPVIGKNSISKNFNASKENLNQRKRQAGSTDAKRSESQFNHRSEQIILNSNDLNSTMNDRRLTTNGQFEFKGYRSKITFAEPLNLHRISERMENKSNVVESECFNSNSKTTQNITATSSLKPSISSQQSRMKRSNSLDQRANAPSRGQSFTLFKNGDLESISKISNKDSTSVMDYFFNDVDKCMDIHSLQKNLEERNSSCIKAADIQLDGALLNCNTPSKQMILFKKSLNKDDMCQEIDSLSSIKRDSEPSPERFQFSDVKASATVQSAIKRSTVFDKSMQSPKINIDGIIPEDSSPAVPKYPVLEFDACSEQITVQEQKQILEVKMINSCHNDSKKSNSIMNRAFIQSSQSDMESEVCNDQSIATLINQSSVDRMHLDSHMLDKLNLSSQKTLRNGSN